MFLKSIHRRVSLKNTTPSFGCFYIPFFFYRKLHSHLSYHRYVFWKPNHNQARLTQDWFEKHNGHLQRSKCKQTPEIIVNKFVIYLVLLGGKWYHNRVVGALSGFFEILCTILYEPSQFQLKIFKKNFREIDFTSFQWPENNTLIIQFRMTLC